MNIGNWLSFINLIQNSRTILAMVGLSLLLSTASLLLLTISYIRLKGKFTTKNQLNQPKFPTMI